MVQVRPAVALAALGLLCASLLLAAPAGALRPVGPDVDALVLETTDAAMVAVRAAGGDAGETSSLVLGKARDITAFAQEGSERLLSDAVQDGSSAMLANLADGANKGLDIAAQGARLAGDAALAPVPGLLGAADVAGDFTQSRLLSLEGLDRPILTAAPGLLDPLPVPTVDAAYGVIIDVGELLIGLEGFVDIRPGPLTSGVSGYAYDSAQTAAEWTDGTVADSVAFADALAGSL